MKNNKRFWTLLENNVLDTGRGLIALPFEDTHNDKDALIIAAAPEMLEALEKILMINGSTGGASSLIYEFKFIAQQAIAKARGE